MTVYDSIKCLAVGLGLVLLVDLELSINHETCNKETINLLSIGLIVLNLIEMFPGR